jgi:hypothetical protein
MRVQPWCVVVTVSIACAGLGSRAAAQTGARTAPAKAAASRPSEEERARKLAEGLAATAKVIEDTQAGEKLGQMAEAAKESWTSPYVQRLTACTPLLAEMHKAAQEGRAADLAQAALQGHLVVDSVYEDTTVKLQEYKAAFLQLLVKSDPDHGPLDRAGRDLDAGTKLTSFFASIMDLFDFPIPIVLQYGPAAAQASTFTAVADGLPRVKPSRGRLEGWLRLGYEQQADPAAKKQAAARMAALNVPLAAPKANPPAAKKAAPGR